MAADLAELVAQALVSAATIRGVAPEQVFEPAPIGRGGARVLAALWLETRIGRQAAVRLCRIGNRNQLAPSQWSKAGVSRGDVQAMARAMQRLGAAMADVAPTSEPARKANMPRPMVGAAPALPSTALAVRPTPEGPKLPATRATCRVGKPAPPKVDERIAECGRSPADIAADGYELRFVQERRARTPPMAWSQIAKQLGNRTELDLRRIYDTTFAEPVAPPRRDLPSDVLPGTVQAKLLLAIDGKTKARQLGAVIGRTSDYAYSALSTLRRKGLVTPGSAADGAPRRTEAGERQARALSDV